MHDAVHVGEQENEEHIDIDPSSMLPSAMPFRIAPPILSKTFGCGFIPFRRERGSRPRAGLSSLLMVHGVEIDGMLL